MHLVQRGGTVGVISRLAGGGGEGSSESPGQSEAG